MEENEWGEVQEEEQDEDDRDESDEAEHFSQGGSCTGGRSSVIRLVRSGATRSHITPHHWITRANLRLE